MKKTLNLRRNPRTYVLFGVLLTLIAFLMLISPDKAPQHVIFGSLFLIGGLSSMAYFNRLLVDKDTDELVHQRGLLVPLRTRRYPLRKIRAVNISAQVIRNGDKDRTVYPIRLSGIKDSVVSKHGNPWFSRVVAEQLARRIAVPLRNRVYGVSSVRKSDELDMPLVQRWIRDGERFGKPVLPASTDLLERTGASSYELSIRAQFPQFKYLTMFLFLLVLPAVVDIPQTAVFDSLFYRAVAAFALFFGVLTLAFVGRSSFRIDSRAVSFRQGYLPVRSRMRFEEIEEMVVAGDGITLIGDAKAIWIHWGGGKQDSEYLEAVVPYQIHRIGSQYVQGYA